MIECYTNAIQALSAFIVKKKFDVYVHAIMREAAGLGPSLARSVFDRFLIVQYAFPWEQEGAIPLPAARIGLRRSFKLGTFVADVAALSRGPRLPAQPVIAELL